MGCPPIVSQYFKALSMRRGEAATLTRPLVVSGQTRSFRIAVTAFDGDMVIADLIWGDMDGSGRRIRNTTKEKKMLTADVSHATTTAEALQAIISACPEATSGIARPLQSEETRRPDIACIDAVKRSLQSLANGKGLKPGEIPPNNSSALAVITYFEVNGTLRPPELLSDKTGTVRAQWKNVARGLNFWLRFNKPGDIAWSMTFPNPRTMSAAALPVGIVRGRGVNSGKAPSLKNQKSSCRVDGRIPSGNANAVDPVMLAKVMGIEI